MSLPMIGPVRAFLLQRSRERLNLITWQQRRRMFNKREAERFLEKHRLPRMAPTNPEQREEEYDYFYRHGHKIPLDGRIPPRRPGVSPAGVYVDLPLHEVDPTTGEVEPYSFFYREGIPSSVRKKMGMTGVQANVPKPTVHQKSMINTSPAKTYSPVQRHGRRFPSKGTDQKSFSGRRGGLSNWDGQVRATERKRDWRTAKSKGGSVPRSSRKDPYCFTI